MVAGLEELEGSGRECDSPRKRPVFLVRRHGDLHVSHGRRWKRLHAFGEVWGSGDCTNKRGRLLLHDHGVFPREGIGLSRTGCLHGPASPGIVQV